LDISKLSGVETTQAPMPDDVSSLKGLGKENMLTVGVVFFFSQTFWGDFRKMF
jgi:hypothetical protein